MTCLPIKGESVSDFVLDIYAGTHELLTTQGKEDTLNKKILNKEGQKSKANSTTSLEGYDCGLLFWIYSQASSVVTRCISTSFFQRVPV